jgi:acetylornithine deacetylase/succinyl-diaminopimelate desuccinylase family protein
MEEVVELAKSLLSINSENPPGNEREVAFFIKDFLEDLGLETQLIEFGKNRYNLIASISKKEGLMLNGHMDTVPIGNIENWKFDPLGEIKDGKLYGRGAVDMKGGLACVLAAVKNLVKEKVEFKRKLSLVFVGDEEVGFAGSKFIIENYKDALKDVKYGIIAEPTNFLITIAQKGIAEMKIKIKGKAAHGSRPELGDNAIYKACDVIQELRKLSENLKKKKDTLLGSGTINVGKIAGGTKVNVVPDYCEIEIDRRITPGETPQLAKKQIEKILKKLKIKGEVKLLLSRLPMKLSENSLLVKTLKEIAGAKTKGEAAYTEAELYYREVGIECAIFGPGNPDLCHITNEYIKIDELKKGSVVFEEIIRKFCC